VSRIYWDSMLFIYWLEQNPQFGKRVDAIWSRMQERHDDLVTGVLTLGEVLAGAYKRNVGKERIQEVRALMEGVVSAVIPFTAESADLFGQIKGNLNVRAAHAIHLACAAAVGTDLFLTNDKRLVGKLVPGIQFIALIDTQLF
jgi:uncharacterized protein